MTQNLNIESNGATVAGPVGAVWELELPGHADGGYLWEPVAKGVSDKGLLIEVLPSSSDDVQSLRLDERVGASPPARFRITLREPGEHRLTLVERRPWETGKPLGEGFSLLLIGA